MTQPDRSDITCALCGGPVDNHTGWAICAGCYGHGIDGRYFQWVVSQLEDPAVQGDERSELARAHLLISGQPYGGRDRYALSRRRAH